MLNAPSLPLFDLHAGELSEMLTPQLNSTSAIVRASALQALSGVLTHPDVQEAVAKSPGKIEDRLTHIPSECSHVFLRQYDAYLAVPKLTRIVLNH